MLKLKRVFKQNTHNFVFKIFAGFGRAINRMYENRNHDIYSNGELNLLKKIASTEPKIIFDVGANIGKYSLLANKFMSNSTKFYCFEPVKDTFEKLENNILNHKNITVFNFGLYKENKSLLINVYPSHTHSSLFEIKGVDFKHIDTEQIKLINGDNFISENNIDYIDLLKLDIEGSEMDALKGLDNTLRNKQIGVIQFEYGYINITTKNLLVDYYDFFEKYDYIIGKIYPKKVEFKKYHHKHEDFLGPNFVAVHKNNTKIIELIK